MPLLTLERRLERKRAKKDFKRKTHLINAQGKRISTQPATIKQIISRMLGLYPAIATQQNDIVRMFKHVGKYKTQVTKEFVEILSKKIVKSLTEKDLIIWEETSEKLETIISGIIIEDLMVEDRLNEEVKTLLESKTEEYERSMMDYGRVFQMVKSKLVRERGLIL